MNLKFVFTNQYSSNRKLSTIKKGIVIGKKAKMGYEAGGILMK